jgi:hypothetical protein
VLSRDGWGEIGDGAATFLIVAPSPGRIGASLGSIAEAATGRNEGEVMSQDRQWFVNTLRNLGYTEAADAAARELPDSVSMEELKKFADRYAISRDEVMSQMGGSP